MVKLSSNLTANQLIMTDWGVKHFNSEYSAQKIRTLIAMQQGGCRVDLFTQFNDDQLNAIYLLSIRDLHAFKQFHKSVIEGEPLMHLLDKYNFTF